MIRKFMSLLMFAVLACAGCETTETVLPDEYGGWIEGTVSDGGEELPSQVTVEVFLIGDDEQLRYFEARTDEAGHYRIGVPNGRAVLRVRESFRSYFRHDGLTVDQARADTLIIDGVLQRADLTFGRLRIVGPEGMEEGEEWRRAIIKCLDPAASGSMSEWLGETDGQLVAEFRLVPPSIYRGGIDVEGLRSRFLLPGTFREADADTIVVTAGELATYHGTRPEPVRFSGVLAGVWSSQAGQTAQAGLVAVNGQSHDSIVDVDCDAEGRFEVELPATGDFMIRSEVYNEDGWSFGPYRWAGNQFADRATVYSPGPGDQVDVAMETAGGVLIHALGDPEMSHLWVRGYRHDDQDVYWWRSVDLENSLVVGNLTPGRYRIRCSTGGLAIPTFFGDVTEFEDAVVVEILPGEVTEIDVQMILAGWIRGRLVDAAGEPLPGRFTLAIHRASEQYVTLNSFDLDGWYDDTRFVYDESTGEFSLRHLDPGDYKLRILHDADAWRWYPDSSNWTDAEAITVPEGGASAFIDWQL